MQICSKLTIGESVRESWWPWSWKAAVTIKSGRTHARNTHSQGDSLMKRACVVSHAEKSAPKSDLNHDIHPHNNVTLNIGCIRRR